MARHIFIFFFLFFCARASRADLVLEQHISDTNHTRSITVTVQGTKMRMDDPDDNLSVIADLVTHDSVTLLTKDKTFMKRSGSQILRGLMDEKRLSHGTNAMDAAPAPAIDTGKTDMVNGTHCEIFTWAGANDITQTLWVATNFPNFSAVQAELAKLDQFNESGPHSNGQPLLSRLPGMVVKSETTGNGHKAVTTMASVKVTTVDRAQFEIPPGYTAWKWTSPKTDPGASAAGEKVPPTKP
jgi:hypothetical protein